jgi:hypothetical protein
LEHLGRVASETLSDKEGQDHIDEKKRQNDNAVLHKQFHVSLKYRHVYISLFGSCRFDSVPCVHRLSFIISAGFFAITGCLSSSRLVSLQSPVGFHHLDRVPCVHRLSFIISAGFFAISGWLSSSWRVSLQSPIGFRHLGRFLCNLRLAFVVSAGFFAITG